jgi:glycerol kinase
MMSLFLSGNDTQNTNTLMSSYILAFDQGTTSSRSVLFDKNGTVVAVSQKEITQLYPNPGWVEHNPVELWESQLATAREVIAKATIAVNEIAAIGN